METFIATRVEQLADLDYGEGWIEFVWPDPIYGEESLKIQLDGHCSKSNPFYSGYGLKNGRLYRDRIELEFDERLALQMQMPRTVTIAFVIADHEFERLRRTMEYIGLV